MKLNVIEAAEVPLRRLRSAVAVLERLGEYPAEQDHQRLLDAWSDALTQGSRVFSKLQHGAKEASDRPWFDGVKALREGDPLLAYLKCARDVDEHGLESVSGTEYSEKIEVGPEGITIAYSDPKDASTMRVIPRAGQNYNFTYYLREVRDRTRAYPVPREHLGSELKVASPSVFGRLYLNYIEAVMAEARSRLDGSKSG